MLAGNSEVTSCIVSAPSKLLDSYLYKNKSDVLCPSEIFASLTRHTCICNMSDMQTSFMQVYQLSPGRQEFLTALINYIIDLMPPE